MSRREWNKDEYYDRLIHLDETVKLFIRTSSAFCPEEEKKDLLRLLLPKTKSRHRNHQFEWGMWFQALKGLAENCEANPSDTRDFEVAFKNVEAILSRGKYLSHFLQEMKEPDYEPFLGVLSRLGLHAPV